MSKTKSIRKKVITLMEEKNYKAIKKVFSKLKPIDIAALFDNLPEKNIILLFRILPKDLAAETFVEMDSEQQEMLIKSFSDFELREVVNELYIDDAVDIVEEMPANVVKRILGNTDAKTRILINELLKYPQDSVGSIMTTELIHLRSSMTVADAITKVRRGAADTETIDTCYVTDNVRHLIGNVTIRTLLLSDDNAKISDIMEQDTISVNTVEDREEAVNLFAKYDLTVLPVVDKDMRLVGIVTVDDAIDVLQDETTEDIEKMAAITPTYKPYLKKTVLEIWKSRIPWLLILMISAIFTGMIINYFEDALMANLMLTAYIPMLMDSGGNAGSQASATIIRGLSLKEIGFGDTVRVVWKEFQVSIMCGITLAAVNFIKLIVIDGIGIYVASVVCITLALTVFVAKVAGSILPIAAKRAGVDPTVVSSPFITTIVDTLSLIIYFQIAVVILGI
ncbi:MAG: magnesium transporter [Clostridium sp.]|nr:magnesium transporter [Clostridium sp.]